MVLQRNSSQVQTDSTSRCITLWTLLRDILYLYHSLRCFNPDKPSLRNSWWCTKMSYMVKQILPLVFSLPFRPFLESAPYPFVTMLSHQKGGLIVVLEVKRKCRMWQGPRCDHTGCVLLKNSGCHSLRLQCEWCAWCCAKTIWIIVYSSPRGERRVLSQDGNKQINM